MKATEANPHRYVALDSLRGICACMVFMCHVPSASAYSTSPFVRNSWLFVDFFFVLSGFVIASSYGNRLSQGFGITKFMILRFFRIYPLHIFVLFIFFIFEIAFLISGTTTFSRNPFEGNFTPATLVYSIALVQIFFGPDATPWNVPAWSIAAEFWAYLIFALSITAFPKKIVAASAVVVFCSPIALYYLTDRNMNLFHDGAMIRCLYGFSSGVICWKLSKYFIENEIPILLENLFEITVSFLVIYFVIYSGTSYLSLFAPFIFSIVIIVFARQRGFLSRFLILQPIVFVGTLSYSIYMIHIFIVFRYMNAVSIVARKTGLPLIEYDGPTVKLTAAPLVNFLLVAILFAGVLAISWLSYRFIEEPGRLFGKRLARNWSSAKSIRN